MGCSVSFDYGGYVDREPISVQLLGGFNLRCRTGTIDSLPRRSASLLAYLIMNRNRPQTRDLLAGRFWSDLPEEKARKRLSNTLWQIRSALGEIGLDDLVVSTSTTIQLATGWPLEIDVEEFERRLDDIDREWAQQSARVPLADKLTALIAEYPGDLLAGHYDDWIEAERAAVKDRYTNAIWQAIRLYKGRSDYVTALRYARQLVGYDPLADENHREVMRLCALLGQPAAAERQYRSCCAVLAEELGVEPSWETTELHERIQSEASSAAAPLSALGELETPIIGRSRERAVLLARIDELLNGQGGLLLIEGDPGIGKSRLVEDLADAADWRGVRLLATANTEVSRLRPYHAIESVLSPAVSGLRGEHLAEVTDQIWLQQASEVLPELRQYVTAPAQRALLPGEEPSRMTEALARILLAQGGLGPTLVILEDMHWCDDDSIRVFAGLGKRLSRSGVLICLTYRRFEAEQNEGIWSAISRLEAIPGSTRVVLAALNRSEIRELVSAELGPGALPSRIQERLVEESGGNPLFVLEALQDPEALLLTDAVEREPHEHPDRFPVTVARALQQRLDSLPADVRTVLRGMAVLAEPCSSQLVSSITGLDRRCTLGSLTEAVDRGFLVEIGAGICRFCHDQTRRAVYHAMSDEEILAWHRQIHQALVTEDRPQAEQVAYHADLGELWAEAVHWHTIAAHSAEAVDALGVAAEHFNQADRAAQLAGISEVDRFGDLLSHERALDILGRRDEQEILLKRLIDLDLNVEERIDLAERQAWLMGHTDRHDEAAHLASQWADRALDAGLPNHRLLTVLGVVRYWNGSFYEAIEALRLALKAAPDKQTDITIKNHLGRVLIDVSEFDEGNALVAEALETAEQIGDIRGQVEAIIHQSISALRRGHNAEAMARAEASLPLSRSIGYRYGEGVSLANLATLHSIRGQAGVALDLFDDAAEVFDVLGSVRPKAVVKNNLAEIYAGFLGEYHEAAKLYGEAAGMFRHLGDERRELRAMSRLSGIDWEGGRRRLARRRLQRIIERAGELSDPQVELEARRVIAECLSRNGDHAEALPHLDRALELIDENAVAYAVPSLLALRGEVALAVDDLETAAGFADRAAAANKPESEFGFMTAWRCGCIYRAVRRNDDAASQFALAFRLLESNLAGVDEARAATARSLPRFAAIIEDYERFHPRLVEVWLPMESTPIGRPLKPDEFKLVTWSASIPSDWRTTDAAQRRRWRVLRLCHEAVEQGALARVHDLADLLRVSERTVKRDLAELRRRGEQPVTRRSS